MADSSAVAQAVAAVAAGLPGGGESRPSQVAMAEAVERAIESGRHLVVQAGTGTGKSLAYLLPALRAGRPTVVATATKALQDQLAGQDLPLVAQGWDGPPFTFAVLKGRSNYLCRQRALEVGGGARSDTGPGGEAAAAAVGATPGVQLDFGGDAALGPDGAGDGAGAGYGPDESTPAGDGGDGGAGRFGDDVRRLLAWAVHSPTGDRSDLDFEPHPRAWAALSTTARECPGAFRCPSGPVCFAERARTHAAGADVVVVNTHLYATDVAGDGGVLPEHEVLVLDEAHEVEDVMAAGLGADIAAGRFRALAASARPLVTSDDGGVCDGVAEIADRFDEVLRPLAGQRVLGPGRAGPGAAELTDVLALARGRVGGLAAALRRAGDGPAAGAEDLRPRRARALLAAGSLAEDLATVAAVDESGVAWVEESGPGRRAVSLRSSPVDVGPILAERLWPRVTAVLTSATVPPAVEARLGLPAAETDRIDVGSPFPFRERAMLYCPTHLPDRRSAGVEAALWDEIERLVRAAGGRTLALFTSWRAMRAAVDALTVRLPFRILAQNDLPKPKLVAAFRNEDSACLFATMSFWQGVDVPGSTLSLVVLDRLPFPRPDDPLLQARRDRAGPGAFGAVDLPRAATLLAQGAGRLIRRADDAGVVAVLDPRLARASYRRVLLDALPPMRRSTDPEEVQDFLRRLASAPGNAAPAVTPAAQ